MSESKPNPFAGYMPFVFSRPGERVVGTVHTRDQLVVVTTDAIYLVRGGETEDDRDWPEIRMVTVL